MNRQDKTVTERNARILRDLVKRPENKICADCKRNDPRWASWNLGVFLCIRCSGIHRSLGTHISRVKSIDLDVWTPDQMESISKWGNERANMYWEAHLKPGHIPPDHKVESFIRSKYDSRRWAMEGPPPSDPSLLDKSNGPAAPTPPTAPAKSAIPLDQDGPHYATTPQPPQSLQSTQRELLSKASVLPPADLQTNIQPASHEDLFSLDFNMPSAAASPSATQTNPKSKDVKSNILSLYSSTAPKQTSGTLGGHPPSNNIHQTQNNASFVTKDISPSNSEGVWSTFPSVWNDSSAPQQTTSHGANIWGTSSPNSNPGISPFQQPNTSSSKKADEAFGDIWDGFR